MNSIISVNTLVPGHDDYLDYDSGTSLKDYDIILFDPSLPYYERESFSAGGSCISIDGTKRATESISHWRRELSDAVADGKTVFILLNAEKKDQGATGSTSSKGSRTFHTTPISNYDALPFSVKIRNGSGVKIKVIDTRFAGLLESLKDHISYRAMLPDTQTRKICVTRTGNSPLGAVVRLKDMPGNLVLLPYFNLSQLYETNSKDEEVWTKQGMGLATSLKKQLVGIDGVLRNESSATPAPDWLDKAQTPELISSLKKEVNALDAKIEKIKVSRQLKIQQIDESLTYQALLYETGPLLEQAVEKALKLLGYEVGNFREGDLEIDHVVVSPDNLRMIGEAEGKDNSAINISKFRQLESNIGEDFEREEVTQPAKGILFGNGFRLTNPESRGVEFTEKCLLNAKRLGTALVSTHSLYPLAVYLQDHHDDTTFKEACRKALETTAGQVVVFPTPPAHKE